MSYNVNGLDKFINLSTNDLQVLIDCDVIVLIETWVAGEDDFRLKRLKTLTPTFNFNWIPAKEPEERGRNS